MTERSCVIGVDAGTGSVRAGVFDLGGTLLGSADCPIQLFRPRPDYVEQSSRDIWRAVGAIHRARGDHRKTLARREALSRLSERPWETPSSLTPATSACATGPPAGSLMHFARRPVTATG